MKTFLFILCSFILLISIGFFHFYPHYQIKDLSQSLYSLWQDEQNSANLIPESATLVKSKNEPLNIYENKSAGFEVMFPSNWQIDNHQPQHYTRFFNKNFRIEITKQDVKKAWVTVDDFIKQTLEPVEQNIFNKETSTNQSYKIEYYDYKRELIFDKDLNYYRYAFLIKDNNVFVFQLKTNIENWDSYKSQLETLLSSFSTIPTENMNVELDIENINPNIKYTYNNSTLNIPKNHFVSGIYKYSEEEINKTEKELNGHFGAQMFYHYFKSDKRHQYKQTIKEERVPLITFQFYESIEKKEPMIEDVLQGNYDSEIIQFAKTIKSLKKPVFVRIGNEMNGSWALWSHKYIYNDSDLYKLSYRRIVDIFKKLEINNAYFVWNPNNREIPYFSWNHASMYYPGDEYVDWIGLTAYNFGQTEWEPFQSFDDLYHDLYRKYLTDYGTKPMMITEFASAEKGGSKAEFIEKAYKNLPSKYPNIKMVFWFDKNDSHYEFKINSSKASENAFEHTFKSKHIIKYPYLANP